MPWICPTRIKVEDRFRQSLTDIDQLAEDIKVVGQLQPILVVENDNGEFVLVAGARRLEACKRLGRQVWWESQKTMQGTLIMDSPLQLRRMELQENVSRRNFTTVEELKAIAEIDRLMKEIYGAKKRGPVMDDENPGWSYEQTANLLGFASKGSVSRAVKIAELAEAVPDINEAESITEAEKMLAREIQKAARAELLRRSQEKAVNLADEAPEENPMSLFDWADRKIWVGKAEELFPQIESGSINIIMADPPYELGVFGRMAKGGYAEGMTEFDDKKGVIDFGMIFKEFYRVLGNKGWLFLFGSFVQFFKNQELLTAEGFSVFEIPLFWVKGQSLEAINPSYNPQPFAWPSSAVECILMAKKGNPSVARHRSNVIVCQKMHLNQKSHASQKPLELLEYLIQWVHYKDLTDEVLLDPFCGSASSLIAASNFPRLDFIGFEKDPGIARIAKENLIAAKLKVQNLHEGGLKNENES